VPLVDPVRSSQADELRLEELAGSLIIGTTTYALSNVRQVDEFRSGSGELDEDFEDELNSSGQPTTVSVSSEEVLLLQRVSTMRRHTTSLRVDWALGVSLRIAIGVSLP
jgi:hypothetical protein